MKPFLIFSVLFFTLAGASFNVYDFKDKAKETRFDSLIKELRCPKCQNNNLADSNAPLATDIKNYVYRAIEKDESNREITDFLVSRYGEFILFRPRNPLIWLLPTMIGLGGFLVALLVIYRNRRRPATNDQQTFPDMKTIINDYEQEQDPNDK